LCSLCGFLDGLTFAASTLSFPSFEIIAGTSVEEIDINIKDMLPGLFQGRTRKRRVKVPEALEYLIQGLTSKEIAERMHISVNTVKAFLRLIMVKMGVTTRSGIVGMLFEVKP